MKRPPRVGERTLLDYESAPERRGPQVMDDRWLNWNWGVPDWHDKDAYPKPGDLTLLGWRWEFERRRPEYREDWLLYAEKTYRGRVQQAQTIDVDVIDRRTSWIARENRKDLLRTIDDPNFYAYRRQPAEIGPWRDYKWNYIQDPTTSKPNISLLEHQTYGVMLGDTMDAHRWLPRIYDSLDSGRIAITFDLRKPLPPQVKKAKHVFDDASWNFAEEFEDLQSKQRRTHMKKWPTYLRIIDARDAGATWRKIYETILQPDPDETNQVEFDSQSEHAEQTARAKWEAAQELMNNFPA